MDYSPPGSSVHGVSQARTLEWVVISFSRGSFWSRDWTAFIQYLPLSQQGNPSFKFVVQLLSRVRLFVTPWTVVARLPCPSISQSLLKLISIELIMPSNHFILCHPFLLLLSIFSSIRVFSNESFPCIRWPKYWSFSFIISHFNDYSGLTSFRIDCSDLLAVQGTLKSLLQHNSLRIIFSVLRLLYGQVCCCCC